METQISMTFTVHGNCSEDDRRILRRTIFEILSDSKIRDSLVAAERRVVERLLIGEALSLSESKP